ncbi:MAG: glycosyltransferase [Vicinamibacterales bacterium]
MSPRIDVVAPPMAGHLHPTLGVAVGLARAFDVRVVSSEGVQHQIAAAGLRGQALLPGRDAAIRAIVEPDYAVGSNPILLRRQLVANLGLLAEFREALHALWQREGPPRLVVADFTLPVVGTVARAFDVPWWTTHPSPCVIETVDGTPAYLGGWAPVPGVLGTLRDAMGRRVIRAAKRTAHWLHRDAMRRVGLDAIYRPDRSEAVYSPTRVFALGVPELEFPRTWPSHVRLVGPVRYTPPTHVPPPPFVEGRRHVLVTIGTHLPWAKQIFADAAAQAAAALPEIEIHFTDGRVDGVASTRGSAIPPPPNFHRLPYVSYARDLARYALVVHHAGTGVLSHALAADLPAVVAPLDYDQPDYATRLEVAGLAHRLSHPSRLAETIRAALDDRAMAECARAMGAVVRASDAVGAIVGEARTLLDDRV